MLFASARQSQGPHNPCGVSLNSASPFARNSHSVSSFIANPNITRRRSRLTHLRIRFITASKDRIFLHAKGTNGAGRLSQHVPKIYRRHPPPARPLCHSEIVNQPRPRGDLVVHPPRRQDRKKQIGERKTYHVASASQPGQGFPSFPSHDIRPIVPSVNDPQPWPRLFQPRPCVNLVERNKNGWVLLWASGSQQQGV